MQKNNVKLIAMDLDGTLTQHKSPLSAETRKTLEKLSEKYKLLMVGISMLRESGTLELISSALSPILLKLKIPSEVLPLAILRPISGSASLAVVTDIFRTYGPDSAAGTIASVMMGSTETTFYTIAVYFGAAGIKNTRHTVASALTADITAILLSTAAARMIL